MPWRMALVLTMAGKGSCCQNRVPDQTNAILPPSQPILRVVADAMTEYMNAPHPRNPRTQLLDAEEDRILSHKVPKPHTSPYGPVDVLLRPACVPLTSVDEREEVLAGLLSSEPANRDESRSCTHFPLDQQFCGDTRIAQNIVEKLRHSWEVRRFSFHSCSVCPYMLLVLSSYTVIGSCWTLFSRSSFVVSPPSLQRFM